MKTPDQRGQIGAWAYRARDEAGLSIPQVLEKLRAQGQAVTDSTIRGIEGGSKKPGRSLLRALGTIYSSEPPGQAPEPEETLVSVIARQAAAIEALASAIDQDRKGRAAWERGLLQSIRDLVAGRAEGPSGDPVPPLRAGSQQ